MNSDSGRTQADCDDIATLIHSAGKRPAVPPERTMRVKTAVQAHWLREVARRRHRRFVWTTAALAAAAALVIVVSAPRLRPNPVVPPDDRIAGTVESVVGDCWSGAGRDKGSAPTVRLGIRQDLVMGSVVTTGDAGRIALRLASGYSVKMDRGSRVRLVGPAILALDTGAVYVDSEHSGGNAGTLRIQTPLGTIQEIGTRYEVRLEEGSVRVRVREGLVILDDGNRTHQIPPATELTLDTEATATTKEIATADDVWSWISEISVMPDLKGLTARQFLEWAARERNWRLVFATDDLARSASEIVLGGSAGGLTLEESLEAVLPACGLSYRVEGDSLIINPSAAFSPPATQSGTPTPR